MIGAADRLILELKAVREIAPIHSAIVVSYLEATGKTLSINFRVPRLKDGVQRVVLS